MTGLAAPQRALAADGVAVAYPGDPTPIIDGLDLGIETGTITTIIGPNGCGKSTLLRALGRLLHPSGGSVLLDGQDIHRLPGKELARRLGILTQQPAAPQGISVEDLVRRGRYPHQGFFQSPTSRDDDAVERALALAGMDALRKRPIDSLSGGQRQRAWIAMALAQETDLLLLDEPTTFLDIAHREEVMTLVRRLNQDQGTTILMVLHDVNEAAATSDRIVAMKGGAVIRSGTPAAVIDGALLEELYGVVCDILPHPDDGRPVCVPRSSVVIDEPSPSPRVAVEVRSLSTGYDSRTKVSSDVSIALAEGSITSIVGPNGCGKSTLLRTATRLMKPLGGSTLIDGVDTRSGSRRTLARRLSIVLQGGRAPNGFLVEDVVAAGRTSRQTPLRHWARADSDAVSAALDVCGLSDLRYREVDTLSGGQLQRTWIAMALAQDAPVLFLDEPTTFLDLGYQIEVLDLIHRLNREQGKTIVMVLHDINLASRYSDTIVVMRDGQIVDSGPPQQVVTRELGRDVFGIQSVVLPDARTDRPLIFTRLHEAEFRTENEQQTRGTP